MAACYAATVNGLDALALTKLDVLDGLPELQVCTAYRCNGDADRDARDTAQLAACEPAQKRSLGGQRRRRDEAHELPREGARMSRASKRSPACRRRIVSTGSGRDETILREGVLSPTLAIR